ncbi:MAG: ATP-binding protein, partial [Eggerthellaceae bacterium]|nr:ATP-binding protein [Eggerthellaceae bacterium]
MAEQIEQSYLESLEVENKRLKRRVERMTKELRHMVNLHDRSVSLRIYSEHEMLLQKEAAEAATRAKSAFLASMSHEIRTPLNAVIGMAEVAKKELPVANIEAHKAFDEILIASRHLLGILNNVLDFSKIESGKLDFACESFALKAALESVEAIILPRCQEKNLELASNVSKLEEISVMGDELRLKQVLINLLGNAVKFTPDQGRIQFFVDVKKLDPRKAEEEAAVQAGIAAGEAAVRARLCEGTPGSPGRVRAFFAVKDNGIGIAPQHIDKLFVAFEQSDTSITKQFGGTGLGLAICQRLVTEMGGEITVASELGKGSRFQFTLDFDLAPISRSAFSGA